MLDLVRLGHLFVLGVLDADEVVGRTAAHIDVEIFADGGAEDHRPRGRICSAARQSILDESDDD